MFKAFINDLEKNEVAKVLQGKQLFRIVKTKDVCEELKQSNKVRGIGSTMAD